MPFSRLRLFWNFQRRLFVPVTLLCALLSCGNVLFWMSFWAKNGMQLCGVDSVLACAKPSFSFMILTPICLAISDANCLSCSPERIIKIFDTRGQIFRVLAGMILCDCVLIQTTASLTAILTGIVLFHGDFTMNWNELGSTYWYSTGHILKEQIQPVTIVLWQWGSNLIFLIVIALLFLIISVSGYSHRLSSALGWSICLALAWTCSFPITASLNYLQRTVCFSAQMIDQKSVPMLVLTGITIAITESSFLSKQLQKKDYVP